MGFPRQEYWRGLPFPPPEDLPDPGIKSTSLISPALGSLPSEPPGKPKTTGVSSPGELPYPGIELGLLHCRQILYQLSYQRHSAWNICMRSASPKPGQRWLPNLSPCSSHHKQQWLCNPSQSSYFHFSLPCSLPIKLCAFLLRVQLFQKRLSTSWRVKQRVFMLPQLSSLIIIYLLFNFSKYLKKFLFYWVFPGGASGKESAYQCWRRKRCRFHPLVRRIPWRRKWEPAPVSLPGKCLGQRSLMGYSPWGHKGLDMTECTHTPPYVIASQYCVSFCCTTKWIRCNHHFKINLPFLPFFLCNVLFTKGPIGQKANMKTLLNPKCTTILSTIS